MNLKIGATPRPEPRAGREQRLVPAERLRWTLEPRDVPAAPGKEAPRAIPGQPRASEALEFGLAIPDAGYHLFVTGPSGIGKMTAVRSFLDEFARSRPKPSDWCYVFNFKDADRPRVLRTPAGTARRLRRDMQELLDHLQRDIPKSFDSDDYRKKREEVVAALGRERAKLMAGIGAKAERAGFELESSAFGLVISPKSGEGEPAPEDLPPEQQEKIRQRRDALESAIKDELRALRELETGARQKLRELDRGIVLAVFGALFQEMLERYRGIADVVAYLESVRDDVLQNVDTFKRAMGVREEAEDGEPQMLFRRAPALRKYAVNVLIDNSELDHAPIVVEWSPWLGELCGRCEKESHMGSFYTDFTLIRAGALHRANGGVLVIPVEELLKSPFSWDALKRALRTKEVRVEDLEEKLGWLVTRGLRPEPIPLDLKVVLVGRPHLFYLLHAYDEDFAKLFRVRVEFDTRVPRDGKGVAELRGFVDALAAREGLPAFGPDATAKIVEQAARLAESQTHLSANFGALAEIARESAHWAREESAARVDAAHVRRALQEKVYRSNLVESRIREMIRDGTILLDLTGRRVGRVNGLSVIQLGEYAFGKPSRITASVGAGREGLLDIEREVEMSGPIHSKGVLILNGYLVHRFAQTRPLTLSARLVFEQSYEGVEGDSASSAELYALLSELSGLPIRQGVAVTGSVNQHGEVQPIGGVNEKIEGFYDACRLKGLNGEQGVLIPAANLDGLMLREDVVEAARKGRFHVWAVKTVDEGIELLTGVHAGRRSAKGRFPEDSVNGLVEKRLQRLAESLKAEEARAPTPVTVSLTTAATRRSMNKRADERKARPESRRRRAR